MGSTSSRSKSKLRTRSLNNSDKTPRSNHFREKFTSALTVNTSHPAQSKHPYKYDHLYTSQSLYMDVEDLEEPPPGRISIDNAVYFQQDACVYEMPSVTTIDRLSNYYTYSTFPATASGAVGVGINDDLQTEKTMRNEGLYDYVDQLEPVAGDHRESSAYRKLPALPDKTVSSSRENVQLPENDENDENADNVIKDNENHEESQLTEAPYYSLRDLPEDAEEEKRLHEMYYTHMLKLDSDDEKVEIKKTNLNEKRTNDYKAMSFCNVKPEECNDIVKDDPSLEKDFDSNPEVVFDREGDGKDETYYADDYSYKYAQMRSTNANLRKRNQTPAVTKVQPICEAPISAQRMSSTAGTGMIQFVYVEPGTTRSFDRMTVQVPPRPRASEYGFTGERVRFGWGRNPVAGFPHHNEQQRFLTDVLHCLPHEAAFDSPVIVTVSLPEVKGQVSVWYSATDVGDIPRWTKLKSIGDKNDRFTDDDEILNAKNVVFIDRNKNKAVFHLHHFCSFVIVEEKQTLKEVKEAKIIVYQQLIFLSPSICIQEIRVVVGCDFSKLKKACQTFDGNAQYEKLEETECLLYEGCDRRSTFTCGLRDIEWTTSQADNDSVNQTANQNEIKPKVHALDRIWRGIAVVSLFKLTSHRSTKDRNDPLFTCTAYVKQDDCLETSLDILCVLKKRAHRDAKNPSKKWELPDMCSNEMNLESEDQSETKLLAPVSPSDEDVKKFQDHCYCYRPRQEDANWFYVEDDERIEKQKRRAVDTETLQQDITMHELQSTN